jgi:hypothetical protein
MDIFENLRFKYEFRKHQNMMLQKFEQNNRQNKKKIFKFHLVSPPGERVIIVTGCINTLISRVSGTFIKNNSCIA